ncbi:UNKNOWN [Stylonychia lemnae]|uniref:Uncharacterized protein n=1 Tax=Stylonychia lemnae TaxID=5949 RepID=A0A078AEQ1_STYLE|nr:UNKNOWN [Stylonychia lemnae]|eukprot:CDW80705.1 UNKNOWN [Stylonychia lemnae]
MNNEFDFISEILIKFLRNMSNVDTHFLGSKLIAIFKDQNSTQISQMPWNDKEIKVSPKKTNMSQFNNPHLASDIPQKTDKFLKLVSMLDHQNQDNYNSTDRLKLKNTEFFNNPLTINEDLSKQLYQSQTSKDMTNKFDHEKGATSSLDMFAFTHNSGDIQGQDIFDKLYNENVKKREKIIKQKQERELEELQKCTFQPQINQPRLSKLQNQIDPKQDFKELNSIIETPSGNSFINSVEKLQKSKFSLLKSGIASSSQNQKNGMNRSQSLNNNSFVSMRLSNNLSNNLCEYSESFDKSASIIEKQVHSNKKANNKIQISLTQRQSLEPSNKILTRNSTNKTFKDQSKSNSKTRHEQLYNGHKERQEKLEQKKIVVEQERLKECSFKPVREAKKYEKKTGLFNNLDSYERVYKFQVSKQPQQNILVTDQQKDRALKQQVIKENIKEIKNQKSELKSQKMSKLLSELHNQMKQSISRHSLIIQGGSRDDSRNKNQQQLQRSQETKNIKNKENLQSDEVLFQQLYLKKNYDSSNSANARLNLSRINKNQNLFAKASASSTPSFVIEEKPQNLPRCHSNGHNTLEDSQTRLHKIRSMYIGNTGQTSQVKNQKQTQKNIPSKPLKNKQSRNQGIYSVTNHSSLNRLEKAQTEVRSQKQQMNELIKSRNQTMEILNGKEKIIVTANSLEYTDNSTVYQSLEKFEDISKQN